MSIEVRAQNTLSMTSVKAIKEATDQSAQLLAEMEQYAEDAGTTLTGIYQDAKDAQDSADRAQASADSASGYASRAFGNLSTVQSITETLAWITQHGTMTLTTDTAIDPTHVYFVVDANGDYVVNSTHYAIVTEPDVADLSTYYELSIDESLNNYVGTHLALTSEGLWLLPASSGTNKVLIATGAGSTYTTAGTYIIDDAGNTVASFRSNGVTIGENASGKTRSEITANGMYITRKDGSNDIQIANLGYGLGNDRTGTNTAPYYTLGTRISGSDIGNYSTAEGYNTIASGYSSHAEGHGSKAIDYCSHAEGANTYSKGEGAHAEGYTTTSETIDGVSVGFIRAMADGAHAEGCATHSNTSAKIVASGLGAHAEGYSADHSIYAEGKGAHAEGGGTGAYGDYSHAQNYCTEAYSDYQTTLGKYNVTDHNNTYAVIIGNGTAGNATSNALMVDWNGDIYPQATKMADFIVDQGTDGMWVYRKWNSGIAECWGRVSVASHTYNANGGYYNVTGAPPTGLFVSGSNPVLSATGGITGNVQTNIGFTFASNVNIQTYLINRNTSAVTNTAWVCWYLVGKWK